MNYTVVNGSSPVCENSNYIYCHRRLRQVFAGGMQAKLTEFQLCQHAAGKFHYTAGKKENFMRTCTVVRRRHNLSHYPL